MPVAESNGLKFYISASISDLMASAKSMVAPTHSAYLPNSLPSVFPKNIAPKTRTNVTAEIMAIAKNTEKVRSISVTPTASASMLVATACNISTPKVKFFLHGQEAFLTSTIFHSQIFSFTMS